MKFIHQSYQPGETIAAIATPIGEGGVSIIRIAGNHALEVAAKIFSGPVHSYKTHTAHYGQIKDLNGQHVDDVLLLLMLGKRSFPGEDTVEIHCHGGSLITRRVLEVVLTAGARAALPGEFSFKAFMNGKLDLTQAEAIQELICAKNERALDAAENQLKGSLSLKIKEFQTSLFDIAAILEAWVDFPDEGLEFASFEEVINQLENTCQSMQKLEATFHDGKILHDGISLCLAGLPNAGKSSLMNALLEKDRAIVSDIPGTTRDILEDHLRLNGLNFRLVDTAGIRHSDEPIEKEGIRRTREAMNEADLIVAVVDQSEKTDEKTLELINSLPRDKTILVWNKCDLPSQATEINFPHQVQVSARLKSGLDDLREKIDQVIWEKGPPSKEEVIITNTRHKEALAEAVSACKGVINGLKNGVSPEFVSFDMRQCLQALGRIIGTDITEDILSAIFSKFCIGK